MSRNLKVLDKFFCQMRPENMDAIEDGALQVTGLTREQIAGFPETKLVWPTFVEWVNSYNKNNTVYTAPIPCGYNIVNYDMVLTRRYCKKYKTAWDETRNDQKIFSQVYRVDLLDHIWMYFENLPKGEIPKLKFDAVREYMGFSEESKSKAHNALADAEDEAILVARIVNTFRWMTEESPVTKKRRWDWRNCMRNAA